MCDTPLHFLTLFYCIVLANTPIDFIVSRPSFFERTGEEDKAFVVCILLVRLH